MLGLVGANPIDFDMPQKGTFNLRGGMQILPEFVALLLGLVTYTAAFIAEVVRAGILAVSKGRRKPPVRSASARARPCGSWSSRRPCGSSFRR